jgi:hypothetical protein
MKNKVSDLKSSDFKASKLLPQQLIIVNAGNDLYGIGLSLFPFGSKDRKIIFNPLLIFIINSLIIIRSLISLSLNENNRNAFVLIGDFTYFIKARFHFNIAIILLLSLTIISQLINFFNYQNDIKPIYLKPFSMISGSITPKSIGLSNTKNIYNLINRLKILLFFCKFQSFTIIPASFAISVSSIVLNCSLNEILLYGIPWSLIYSIGINYCASFIAYQMTYFHINCYYFNIKLSQINNEKLNLTINPKNKNVKLIIQTLDKIYTEIREYNENYWSKFLFWILILFNMTINICLALGLFGNINLILKISLLYACFCGTILVIILLSTASSVSSEANKSYKLLNKLYIDCCNRKTSNSIRLKV